MSVYNENGGEGGDDLSEMSTPAPHLTRGHWCAGEYGKAARLPVYPFISEAIAFCKVERDSCPVMGCRAITLPLSLFSPSSPNFPVPLGAGAGGGERWEGARGSNQVVHRTKTKLVFRVDPL